MSMDFSTIVELAVGQQLQRASVSGLCDDGSIEVSWAGGTAPCDVLWTAAGPVTVAVNDAVLVMIPAGDGERGVIVGRIGPPALATTLGPATSALSEDMPSELVLEARESLTLRVGEGSITIRADGKILIKGKDLVSHAKRVNRIRGGSVAIN